MHLFLTYTILGLVTGAVYGIAASGLVLTYTTSGIFNFAQGAMAMIAAFTYWQFRFGWNWPAPLALFTVIAVLAPLLGIVLYGGIMRGLRQTADVTKIVVTIGIMLGLIALAQWIWNPGVPRTDNLFFGPAAKFKFLGVYVTDHEAIALGCGVLIAVGIRLLFTSTRTGVAMRAVVDSPELLQLNGGRPERLAAFSWALGAALAALAGILITPISGGTLDVHVLTLLVLDSIAAAMFGRLRSIWLTFAGALVLGLSTTYVLGYFPSSWSWATDFRIALPMIVLFVVLLVLPQERLRGATLLRTRERFTVPTVRSAVTWGVILVLAVLLLEQIMGSNDMATLTLGITYAIIALSLTLLTGYAGEINLAPVSFGAIATIIVFHVGLSGTGLNQRITIWGLFLGVVVTALVGGLIALPALRLRGLYLALATLAFGVFVSDMILNDIAPHILPIFHLHFSIFPNGTLQIPALKLGPIDLSSSKTFLTVSTVIFVLIGIGLIALRRSNYGRRLTAMKDSPAAAATLGQNLIKLKLSVFMLSAAIAGIGGILLSAASVSVSATTYIIFISLALVMLTVVGGIGSVAGALMGGILAGTAFQVLNTTFTNLSMDRGGGGFWSVMANLALVAPALVGVSLGRNPSGAVPQIVANYSPLWRVKSVLALGVVAEVVVYLLVLTKVMGNWWFVLATGIIALALPAIGRVVRPGAFRAPTSSLEPLAPPTPTPPVAPEDAPQFKEQSMPGLEVSEVSMAFGGAQVLSDVSISVGPGGVTGLIGPNGAGKTTLFNIVSGLLAPKSGRIVMDGRDITKAGPAARARRGLARTYQRLELFTSLTVRDNIRVAGEIRNSWGRRGRIDVGRETDRTIDLVGLGDVADREVSEIPTARARVVEVARALMTQPKVLLLDEPASGQTEQETEAFGRLLRQLVAERDVAICLVEHDVSLVMGACEMIHVLDYGQIIASGTPDHVRNDPAVVNAYLGAAP